MAKLDLTKYGITGTTEVVHNPSYEQLFAEETNPELEGYEKGHVSELGAVNVMTGGVPAVMIGSAVVWFIGLVGLFVLGYLVMVAEQVYRASLYLYAQYDVVGADFSEDEIAGAFKMKK